MGHGVFTLAADTFLLLLNRWYRAGIVLFCVVQGLYLARIRRACGPPCGCCRRDWCRGVGAAECFGNGTALNLLAALYFVNFLVNAFQSLTLRSERLFAAGDVAVSAVRRMRGAAGTSPSLLPGLARAAQVRMWLFYLPGQVLLEVAVRLSRERGEYGHGK